MHPCETDATLEGCAEIVAQATPIVTDLKAALVANAPMITERLNNAMLKIGTWVEATESFAVEQTPLLVQEIIWWGIIGHGYWLVFGLMLLSALPLTLLYLRRSSELQEYSHKLMGALNEEGDPGDCPIAIIGGFILPIIGFLCVVTNIMATLKPLITPRLYLIEYFQQLVK